MKYKKIKLQNCNKYAIIDEEDYDKISKIKWRLLRTGYVSSHNSKTFPEVLLHRFILNLTNKKIHVDHINDNKLDNRKSNLRICSNQQNTSNKRKTHKYTSQYKGVSLRKDTKKWRATIMFMYKQVHIGTFLSEKDAARAYNTKAKELFGEFARLNKV